MMAARPGDSAVLQQEALELLHESLKRTRDLNKMLMPYNVQHATLQEAMEDFVAGLHVENFEVFWREDPLPNLTGECLVELCRLLQEIIHNTIKHSHAARLKVDLGFDAGILSIRTAEDGWKEKFSERFDKKAGVGKELMESRVRLLKGNIHISSEPATGTRYVINIPITTDQIY
ncbi:MAG: hypothetical protein EOO46_00115 [Flavobacterium sp.]|nr:MAG: hypothetical protein EOO46_00115 [Flavobacterium sp.]